MKFSARSGRFIAVLGLASILIAAASIATSAPIAPRGYPRLAFYGSIRGNGYPFYNFPIDTTLNDTALDKVSRFEEITLDVNPIWPYRPDVIQQLRQRNPQAKILAYVVGHDIWPAADRDSLNHYPTRYRRLVDNNQGWLYNTLGQKWYAGNVNLAKKDGTGRFVIADSLALLWKDVAVDSHVWDGLFFDILCDNISWAQNSSQTIDYQRAGYSTLADFDFNWHAATDTIAQLMRSYGGPNYILVGNCAAGTKYSTFNGWMREGFPYETGGEWYTNMFWVPGGYMTDEANFQSPRHNYIFSFQVGTDQYSDQNARIERYGLGSATLGDGFGVFGGQDRDAFHADYHTWWYDEYAVDRTTGQSSELPENTGWLGQPLSKMYQMIWIGNQPEGVQNPDFETSATQNWSFVANSPATITRDTTTAGHGRCSARIDILQANSTDWKVNFNTPLAITLDPWTTYSVTLWVKASTPRNIPVIIGTPGQGQWFSRTIYVDTDWHEIQVPFTTDDRSGSTSLLFYLATTAGSVWIDGVHVQRGITTVYRRDFQNGTVLVNPSLNDQADVIMERPFQRILGVRDPITNNGTSGYIQSVGPSDALFLLGDDITPPAIVKDLRQVNLRP